MKKSDSGILATIPLVIAGIAVVPNVGFAASSSICDAVVGNVVLNCGFEGGTQTLSATVPSDWTANTAYTSFTGFNNVVGGPVNSGGSALQIGNDDPSSGQGTPMLSQTFADTSGLKYNVSYYLQDQGNGGAVTGDPNSFFNAQINGTILSSFTGVTGPGPYTKETFSFTATGSDTLTFAADTSPGEWYLDDVVVTTVPLPTSAWLMLSGLIGIGAMAGRPRAA